MYLIRSFCFKKVIAFTFSDIAELDDSACIIHRIKIVDNPSIRRTVPLIDKDVRSLSGLLRIDYNDRVVKSENPVILYLYGKLFHELQPGDLRAAVVYKFSRIENHSVIPDTQQQFLPLDPEKYVSKISLVFIGIFGDICTKLLHRNA